MYTVIEHQRYLNIILMVQYSQRHSMINHCDRRITLLNDADTFWSV